MAMVLLMAAVVRVATAQEIAAMAGAELTPANATSLATAPADVTVTLSTSVEEGKKQLVATVMKNGKPVEKATVSFGAKRTFGRLVLGTDVTLDDGTAAIAFPSDLPGNAKGELELDAVVNGPLSQWGARGTAIMPGGRVVEQPAEAFPRALWAPSAPLGLIGVIVLLLGGAWGAYLFVVAQLLSIYRGASK
jgi:hypothetical protein